MDTLKIAMVTTWNVKCGIATYSADLANALGKEDVEVYVVRMSRFGNKTPDLLIDLSQRIPYKQVDLIHVQHEYGLFQGFDAPFYTYTRMQGKPIVTTMHAVGNWDLDVMIAGTSNKVIVHNEFCASRFQYPNAAIIPHGITPSEPTEIHEAKHSLGIEPSAPVVGYLGFISNYKGLETLIQAMVKVPKAGLLIAGGWHTESNPEYIDRLQRWSNEVLPQRVKWTGYVPDGKLADTYGAMDLMVYPSRFSTESGALLHGIAYGKAILASNIEPFREKERAGALETFKDSDDLADKINAHLKCETCREKLEQGARDYAQRCSWEKVAKLHRSLYEAVLNPKQSHTKSSEP